MWPLPKNWQKTCKYFTIYIDVLFFVSLIYPTSRLNFQILINVLETRHLVEIDYSGAPSLKKFPDLVESPLK